MTSPRASKGSAAEEFRKLYEDGLRDIYWAEKHLLKAIPKLAKAAESEELTTALQDHLAQTEGQVSRLEKVFAASGLPVASKKCEGMEGLTKEADEVIQDHERGSVRDAGLIMAAQKVEHYEISGYGSLRSSAEVLGFTDAASMLQETLDEESEADKLLSKCAETINEDAFAHAGDTEEEN
jgi:ferritin-like metal-binding protein YciE